MQNQRFMILLLIPGFPPGKDIPKVARIDTLENSFQPVLPGHGRHAQMASMDAGCIRCHHNSDNNVYLSCSDCHAPDPESGSPAGPSLNAAYHRNRLTCHRDWKHDQVCESCHTRKLFKNWVDATRPLEHGGFMKGTHPPNPVLKPLFFDLGNAGGREGFPALGSDDYID